MIEADYVIVGGGSAGCVLASRLSDDPGVQVVLLEAGTSGPSFLNRIPVRAYSLWGKPDTDWLLQTEPDASLAGRSTAWIAGRMLGGGSAINGTLYIRGARSDYDDWEVSGCTGWGWNEVLPYFLRSEGFRGPPSQSHGTLGPVAVSAPALRHPLADAFIEACGERGFRKVEDYCAGDIDGAFLNYVTQGEGERYSSAYAYLKDAKRRPNLRIVTGAHADRLLIEGGRAAGVRVLRGAAAEEVRSRRETIVSCGTMHSPALLMRSGIGRAEMLREYGIAVVLDSPAVGSNLQEHVSFPASFEVDVPTHNNRMTPIGLVGEMLRYLVARDGLMTMVPVEAMAFIRSLPDLARPDIKLSFGAMCFDQATRKPHRKAGVMTFVNVAKPKGRGEIRLRSADPRDRPVIDHQLLGHPDDLSAMVRGMRIVEDIFAAPALAPHVVRSLMPSVVPRTDSEWIETLRANCAIGFHPVGTCAMGGAETSVVDPRLRVRGIAHLRVVDASVMPVMPAANTNAPTMMIAEKAARMIIDDAVCRFS